MDPECRRNPAEDLRQRLAEESGEKIPTPRAIPIRRLPISLKVTYTLDGKGDLPSDLNGQSGHVVIRYDYTNELYETREIAGKEEKIYVPLR